MLGLTMLGFLILITAIAFFIGSRVEPPKDKIGQSILSFIVLILALTSGWFFGLSYTKENDSKFVVVNIEQCTDRSGKIVNKVNILDDNCISMCIIQSDCKYKVGDTLWIKK
jgi:hypothetical protein